MIEHVRTRVSPAFRLAGQVTAVGPLGAGLINPTFRVTTRGQDGRTRAYVIQAINGRVFPRPDLLMDNLARVTAHLRQRLDPAQRDAARRVLTLVPADAGGLSWRDPQGQVWRAFHYIAHSRTLQRISDPVLAYRAGRAFGDFMRQLADLPPPRLHEHLPGFHHTPTRLRALRRAVEEDPLAGAAQTGPELDRISRREATATLLGDLQTSSALPERIVHNDTKINNLLLDRQSGKALCVIDLDTVMPGLSLNDFGDLVRSAATSEPEGSKPLSLQLPLFEGLLRGWVGAMAPVLTPTEAELLAAAPRVITLELAMRFLTDHLRGNRYFAITYPGQNLDRCRAQLDLLESMEAQADSMERLVRDVLSGR
jgi:hypothetical protein